MSTAPRKRHMLAWSVAYFARYGKINGFATLCEGRNSLTLTVVSDCRIQTGPMLVPMCARVATSIERVFDEFKRLQPYVQKVFVRQMAAMALVMERGGAGAL